MVMTDNKESEQWAAFPPAERNIYHRSFANRVNLNTQMPVDGLVTARPEAPQVLASLRLWRELSVGECVCDVEKSRGLNRGLLSSIKPETPAMAVPYAQKQSVMCTSQRTRYRASKIEGEIKNYVFPKS